MTVFIVNLRILLNLYCSDSTLRLNRFDNIGLSVILGNLRTNVDARLETRSKLAGHFANQIGKDIMELMTDVNALREEVAV